MVKILSVFSLTLMLALLLAPAPTSKKRLNMSGLYSIRVDGRWQYDLRLESNTQATLGFLRYDTDRGYSWSRLYRRGLWRMEKGVLHVNVEVKEEDSESVERNDWFRMEVKLDEEHKGLGRFYTVTGNWNGWVYLEKEKPDRRFDDSLPHEQK